MITSDRAKLFSSSQAKVCQYLHFQKIVKSEIRFFGGFLFFFFVFFFVLFFFFVKMSLSTAVLPFEDPNSQTGTFENGENPDEMSHYAAFHQNLHC